MRKLATAAISFSAAVLLAYFFLPISWLLYGASVAAALSVTCLFFKGTFRLRVVLVSLGLAAGLFWSFLYTTVYYKPAEILSGLTADVTAVVLDYPMATDYGSKVLIRVKADGVPGIKTQLYIFGENPEVQPGDRIELTASFRLADSVYGEKTDAFLSKGIYLLATLKDDIRLTGTKDVFTGFPARLAYKLNMTIERIFPTDTIALMKALILGDTSGVYQDTALSGALSATGTSHIVAVSGMNIAFLMGFLGLFIKKKRALAVAGIPVILLFMAIVGFMAPVVRAGIMQIFLLLAPLVRRENDPVTALSASLVLILLFNPFAVAGIGLQLSFSATLGILLITKKVYTVINDPLRDTRLYKLVPIKKISSVLIAGLASTAGALVFSVPLIALHFGSVSLIAPLTNLLIIFPVTLAFCGGIAAVAFGLIYAPAGTILAFIAAIPARMIVHVIIFFSHMPLASVYTDNPAIVIWLIYVYLLLIICYGLRLARRKLIYPVCLTAATLCIILLATSILSDNRGLSVTAVDVGQGQAIVVTSGKYTAVIDCGSTSGKDAGDLLVKFLQSRGRSSVDLLVLTHYHTDHANGVPELLERFPVRSLAVPVPVIEDDPLIGKIGDIARENGVSIVPVTENLIVSMGEADVLLYAPFGDRDENERGLSILCSENDFDVLITGDINTVNERRLLDAVSLPDIELLVVGHHGSKYSTSDALLDAVKPETAVISVGYNSYGHPSEETLQKLVQSGILVYRTDSDGSISLSGW